jgi:integrase
MPRPRLPNLHRERTRHGAIVWYVRIARGQRVRLRAPYGTPAFETEYRAAIDGRPPPMPARGPARGSLRWLCDLYRASPDWVRLSQATRRQRDNILVHVLEQSASVPASAIQRTHILDGLARRAATPFAAANFLKTMRGLFRWARESGHLPNDPTSGVKNRLPRTSGFRAWTDDDVSAFEARWPIGTRERLALDILLYTGLRKGDAAQLGRQHVRAGIITVRTEKTGEVVTIPLLDALRRSIEATKTGDLAYVATAAGRPMTKESFGNWFSGACRAAGVPGSAHGLRKLGATRAADNGATEYELDAIFGWRGGKTAAIYTREANRRRLAQRAAMLLSADPIPAPDAKVRERG